MPSVVGSGWSDDFGTGAKLGGCQCVPDIFALILGPGVGRGVDFEVGGSRRGGSLRGHHEDQQA
jgi:hypothetical protein